MGTLGSCPGGPQATHANLCMLCTACFLVFKHWFCWKYQYNKYLFNFIDIYSFIPASGCVSMGPSALLWPGACNVVKTALITTHYLSPLIFLICEVIPFYLKTVSVIWLSVKHIVCITQNVFKCLVNNSCLWRFLCHLTHGWGVKNNRSMINCGFPT